MAHTVEKNIEFRNGLLVVSLDALANSGTYDVQLPEDCINAVAQVQSSAGRIITTGFTIDFVASTYDSKQRLLTYPKLVFTNTSGSAFTGKVIVSVAC